MKTPQGTKLITADQFAMMAMCMDRNFVFYYQYSGQAEWNKSKHQSEAQYLSAFGHRMEYAITEADYGTYIAYGLANKDLMAKYLDHINRTKEVQDNAIRDWYNIAKNEGGLMKQMLED